MLNTLSVKFRRTKTWCTCWQSLFWISCFTSLISQETKKEGGREHRRRRLIFSCCIWRKTSRFPKTFQFTTFTKEPAFLGGWPALPLSLLTLQLFLSPLYFSHLLFPRESAKNIFSQTVKSAGRKPKIKISKLCGRAGPDVCDCFFFFEQRKKLWKALTRSGFQVCNGVRSFLTPLIKLTGAGGHMRWKSGKDDSKASEVFSSNIYQLLPRVTS